MLKRLQLTLLMGLIWLSGCSDYIGTSGPVHCGAVDGKEVWTKLSNPHQIDCSTTISGDVVVGPGTIIQFAQDTELIVTGRLSVEGTADEPVLFEGQAGATFAGLSVRGNGGDTTLTHVTISGGGFSENSTVGALTIDSGPVKLNHVNVLNGFDCGVLLSSKGRLHSDSNDIRIKGSTGYALCADVQSAQEIDTSKLTLEENGKDGLWLTGDKVTGFHSWEMTSMPYIFGSSFTLSSADLTIGPGVVLKFERYESMLLGEGGEDIDVRLTVAGTPEAPVTFTGLDEEIGSWGGLYVSESAQQGRVTLSHTLLENGGSSHGYGLGMLSLAKGVRISAQNLELRGSEGLGFSFAEAAGWSADSANITITGNGAPGQMHANEVRTIPATTELSGNTVDRVTLLSKQVDESATWVNLGATYGLSMGLATGNAGTEEISLSMDAGVVLEFAEGTEAELGEQGSANVLFEGTEAEPVVLKGMDSDEDGYWDGLQLSGGLSSASLKHVQIADGGASDSAGLRIDGATVLVEQVQVSGSLGLGFRIRSGGFAAESASFIVTENERTGSANMSQLLMLPEVDSSYTGNTDESIEVVDSQISTAYHFRDLGVPYNVNQGLQVYGGDTETTLLTIAAGTHLLFGDETALRIYSGGAIQAVGTSESKIVFGPYKEEGPGSWQGLDISTNTDGQSMIQHAEIAYAGSYRAAIAVNYGDASITDSYVHNSACYGILVLTPEDGAVVNNITYEENVCGDYSETYP